MLGLVAAADIIDALLTLDTLADLPRTGWLLRGVRPCESVAEHSHGVALVAMMLVDELRAAGQACDGESVLRMALVHDAAEAFTGDIPMPSKSPALRTKLLEMERGLIDAHLPGALRQAWHALAQGQSLEARLVKAADKIQMMIKVLAYEKKRGAWLEDFWKNPRNFDDRGIEPASTVFDAICRRADRPRPR